MKREVIIITSLLFLIFITYVPQIEADVSATEAEFSIRFHSFGKNATINLKEYLGESSQYLVSETENVIIRIDQKEGLAYLEAKPGWEGSEVIFFKRVEYLPVVGMEEEYEISEPSVSENLTKIIEETVEPTKLPSISGSEEFTKELEYKYREFSSLAGIDLDLSVVDLLDDIGREEIKKLGVSKERDNIIISINDEVDIHLERAYIPKVSMNFSLGPKQEEVTVETEEEERKVLKSRTSFITVVIVNILIIGAFIIYFYTHYSKRKLGKKKKVEYVHKDIKHSTLLKLRSLQKDLGEASSERFLEIIRIFFSDYLKIDYDSELEEIIKNVKDSDLNESKKKEMINFLDSLSKLASTYGASKISQEELKKLIRKMKRIIRDL